MHHLCAHAQYGSIKGKLSDMYYTKTHTISLMLLYSSKSLPCVVMQAQLDSLKAESAQAADQLRQAKAQVAAAEKDLNASRQAAYEAAQAATQDKQRSHTTITNLQVFDWTSCIA